MTHEEAQKLVTMLVTGFPNLMSRLSSEQQASTMKLYRHMLLDMDFALANAAVGRLIASSRFMPTIAEIREAALVCAHGQRRPGGEAWGDVLAAVAKFGVYRRPVFSDSLVAHAVYMLDWVGLCSSDNQVADRARFIELYERLASARRAEQQVPERMRRELPEHPPERVWQLREPPRAVSDDREANQRSLAELITSGFQFPERPES
jgi:hypothetical protein